MSTTTSGVTPTPSSWAPPGDTKRCSVTCSTEPSGSVIWVATPTLPAVLLPTSCADLGFLQRRGEDLGARGAVAIDQHDQRHAVEQVERLRVERRLASLAIDLIADAPCGPDRRTGAPRRAPRSSEPPGLPRRSTTQPRNPALATLIEDAEHLVDHRWSLKLRILR